MYIAQKIELKPNKTTKAILEGYFGYSRYIYNKALATWNEMYEEYKDGKCEYSPNNWNVRNRLKTIKEDWESELCPQILETSTENVRHAFNLFWKGISKRPQFKKKNKAKKSFRYYYKNKWAIQIQESNFLKLARLPRIKMKEVIKYDGVIKEVTISQRAGKYFASFRIDTKTEFPQIDNENICGVDMGVKTLAVINDNKNTTFEYPSILKSLQPLYEKIDIYNRMMSKKVYNSNNYLAMKTKLQRVYLKIWNIQHDYMHHLTNWLVQNYKYTTIETLRPSNMGKNRKLSKVIFRSLFGTFRMQMEYKCRWYGNILIKAPWDFASTQICSCCGYRKFKDEKLTDERTYICPECGLVIDRDENAAINLKQHGMSVIG